MNKMKKILSMVLVLGLALALAVPAFSASPTGDGTITINHAVEGKTYRAYRLFDLNQDTAGGHGSYTVNEEWKDFFNGEGAQYVEIDPNSGSVALKEDPAAAQELANAVQAYAESHSVHAYMPTGTAPRLTFSNLPLGYYQVTPEAGALQPLSATHRNAVMNEKNLVPDIDKTADTTNAAYGDTVRFHIPVTKGDNVWGDYIVQDTMTGLELKSETIQVKVNGKALVPQKDYMVESSKDTFTVTILKSTLNRRNDDNSDYLYPVGTVFSVEYEAVAKQVEVMENKVVMKYKTRPEVTIPDGETMEHIVKIANYEFWINKINGENKPLSGAAFELHRREDCSDPAMEFIKTNDTYRLAEVGENAAQGAEKTSVITAGNVKVEGLAAGVYYLKETKAPNQYNKLVEPVKVEIKENLNTTPGSQFQGQAFDERGSRIDPTITINDMDFLQNPFVLNIVNKAGGKLPSTGGIGTPVFYVVGGLMMSAAVVALVIKKRREK